jgi:hypothetical protein
MGDFLLFDMRQKPGPATWQRAAERLGREPNVLLLAPDLEGGDWLVDEGMIIEVAEHMPPGHWGLGVDDE